MKTRIITAVVAIPILVALLLQPYASVWAAVVFAVSLVGLYEFYKATGLLKSKPLCAIGFLTALYFPIWWLFPNINVVPFAAFYIILLFLVMLLFNKTITAEMVGLLFIGSIYIPYLLSHIIGLRLLGNGQYYVWLILICAFMTDSFAYFTGRAFGKHKLCPHISPNKTVAGAIGGVIGCGLCCLLFGFIIGHFFGSQMNFIKLFILGIICSVAAQMGDLTASAIKRQHGIKDYGNIFPGHGGILDRCDSILFVAPVMFYFIVRIGLY